MYQSSRTSAKPVSLPSFSTARPGRRIVHIAPLASVICVAVGTVAPFSDSWARAGEASATAMAIVASRNREVIAFIFPALTELLGPRNGNQITAETGSPSEHKTITDSGIVRQREGSRKLAVAPFTIGNESSLCRL